MKYLYKYILILFVTTSFSQEDVATFFDLTRRSQYNKAKNQLNSLSSENLKVCLKNYLDIIDNGNFQKVGDSISSNSGSIERNLELLNLGLKQYIKYGNELKAFNTLKKSLQLSIKRNDSIIICETAKIILEIYERFNQEINDESYKYFIDTHLKYSYDKLEKDINTYFEYRIIQRYYFKNPDKIKPYYIKANKSIEQNGSNLLNAKLNITNSAYHQLIQKDLDSAVFYLNKAKLQLATIKGYFENEKKIVIKINSSVLQFLKGNNRIALDSIENISIQNEDYLYKLLSKYIHFWKYQYQNSLGKEFESQKNYIKYLEDELKHNQAKNLQYVSEFETKYQTAEKEKQNLILQKQKTQNRNIAFGLGGLLLFGSLIFFLIQKNTKRKQLLAIQERELASQKVTTLLKEQELTAIDAMIEGQEKERQRIANDLHDDLGGLMATVKLHFNALKEKQSPELYKKTTELLDEAYNKVRTVAHTKNSGVMAKKGLLKALNDMAKTVSASNQLQVDIFDHGLNERLENSLELTIFRIVQELITNVIKHAEATEASIHITKHEESLNIMVEDNGKGFNTKNITKKSGMGIHSIDKRIENLGGNVTIESELHKGTTVIIDIPS